MKPKKREPIQRNEHSRDIGDIKKIKMCTDFRVCDPHFHSLGRHNSDWYDAARRHHHLVAEIEVVEIETTI